MRIGHGLHEGKLRDRDAPWRGGVQKTVPAGGESGIQGPASELRDLPTAKRPEVCGPDESLGGVCRTDAGGTTYRGEDKHKGEKGGEMMMFEMI